VKTDNKASSPPAGEPKGPNPPAGGPKDLKGIKLQPQAKAEAKPKVAPAQKPPKPSSPLKSPKKPKKKSPVSVPSLYLRLVIAGVIGLALAAGGLFSANHLKILVPQLQQKKAQLTALSEREVSYEKLAKDFNLVGEEIKIIEQVLIGETGMVRFLEEIERIREETQVEIKTLNFTDDEPRRDKAGHHYVEFTIEASGQMAQFEQFLEKLLSLSYLMKVKTIDLSRINDETSQMIFQAWLFVDPNFIQEPK
jgi:Tfp pilus assembly protein PilO